MAQGSATTSSSRWSGSLFAILLASCGVLVGAGLWLCLAGSQPPVYGHIGLVLLGAGSVGAVASALAYGLFAELRSQRSDARHLVEVASARLAAQMHELQKSLAVIREQQLISDKAKSVAYREKDRDTLRRAIAEDVARGDFEAAMALVDDMEATFGYRAEAERLRGEIARRREDMIRNLMVDVQQKIERLCRAEDWAGAHHEATRFIGQYGDYEPARRLPAEIDARRAAYKKQLMDRWNDCVLRHDAEAGIEVMRLLDPYLTPAESERLAEGARSILNERKARLRESFTSAVSRKDWGEALRIGETIQREFPNARFAREVADSMEALRARAAESAAVTA